MAKGLSLLEGDVVFLPAEPETYTAIEARLRDLEFTVQRLTNSVDRALQTILSAPPKPADAQILTGPSTSCITYLFTPFFVIFENIVHHTCWTPAVEQDLQLLSATMTYYSEMRSQMRLLATVCARQQRVAAIFLRLAQIHVRQYASVQVANDMETSTESRRLSQAGCYCGSAGTFPGVDVEEPDVATYLEWLPADLNLTWPVSDVKRQDPNSQPGAVDRGRFRNASRKAFDSVFDWFSWDAYYAEVEG
ncbi:hypothetical protein NYO67_6019 [Aspergillus flavus]|nr:hypothetical protein NYO67_6019 [Aspergillus flavus]